ncbi:MAG TPA: O-antigen ligase family protein [Solirubrobacteraceae bacterium]|jgi:O-antigen ligase
MLSAYLSGFGRFAEILIVAAVVATIPFALRYPVHGQVSKWAFAFLTYWGASCLLALSYPSTHDFLHWLNADGSPLVGLLPLVLLGGARPTRDDLRYFERLISAFVWSGAALYLLGSAHFPRTEGVVRGGQFWGFASSHHVPGYLFGTCVLWLIARSNRTRRTRAELAVASLLTIATASRTTLLGLGLVAVWFFMRRVHGARRLKMGAVLAVAGLALVIWVPRVGETTALLSNGGVNRSASFFKAGMANTSIDQLPRDTATSVAAVADAENRFALYGFAVGRWLTSPIFGIGSGRFDALSTQYTGLDGAVDFATAGSTQPGSFSTAHNSYLQILAENGIVGLVLILSLYGSAYRAFARAPIKLRLLGQALIVFMLGTGWTGATIQAASLTFSAATLMMLVLGASRSSTASGDEETFLGASPGQG